MKHKTHKLHSVLAANKYDGKKKEVGQGMGVWECLSLMQSGILSRVIMVGLVEKRRFEQTLGKSGLCLWNEEVLGLGKSRTGTEPPFLCL